MERKNPLFIACLLALALVWVAAWLSYWPPGTVAQRPLAEASGTRAFALLERILDGVEAHPTGSDANRLVRDRLIGEMRSMGLHPAIQRGFVCGRFGTCAEVENLLARIEGEQDGALLLLSHYDSVAAGPGAGDDGSGTAAILESARAILARGVPARDVIILITDGEELGLLGAGLFATEHPWRSDVRWVINSEARGTTGPMLMFETSSENLALTRAITRGNRGLVTNSLQYSVYRRLPNDTDLTITREAGWQGVNFGMIGGGHRYHTRNDDLDHLDIRSLDHASRMVDQAARRILAAVPERTGDDAVFFDVLGWFVILWPAAWTMPLALISMVAFFGAAFVVVRRNEGFGAVAAASSRLGAATGIAAAVLAAVYFVLRYAGATEAAWPAEPHWLFLTFAAVSVTLVAAAHALTRGAPALALFVAAWVGTVVLAPIVAALLPGASYLFIVPALTAAVSMTLLAIFGPRAAAPAVLLPFTVNAILLASVLWQLYLGLGVALIPVIAGLCVLMMFGALPALDATRVRPVVLAGIALAVVCAVMSVVRPVWSPDSTKPLAVQLANVDGQAFWVLPASAPEEMLDSASFDREPRGVYPFEPASRYYVAPARTTPSLPDAEVDVFHEREGGTVRIRIPRSTPAVHHGVFLPASRIVSVEIEGRMLREADRRSSRPIWSVRSQASGSRGLDARVTFRGSEPFDLWVYERSYAIPEEGRRIVESRPRWAAPLHDPDRTVAIRTVHVEPSR